MTNLLTIIEQSAVADIKKKYAALSDEAKTAVAKEISILEKHWGWVALALFVGGIVVGVTLALGF